MFSLLREKLDLVDVLEKITKVSYKTIGDSTYAPEDKACPFCGHKDCFRVKQDGDSAFAKCFSCDEHGDVTDISAKLLGISPVEAARKLAKEYNIRLPSDYSPVQEAFNLAAEYYHNLLLEAGPSAELNGLTPVEYQTQIRRHTQEALTRFRIGWSDGKVVAYLEAMGVDTAIIAESGLVNKKGQDFLPAKCFIYPHFVRGRVSHFTFKDPLKQKEYQLPNKNKLNGHLLYNSDSIRNDGPCIIVEGENDAISVSEADWTGGVVCINGSISQAQLEWLAINLANRDVISIFDSDPAGDKYREKVGKLGSKFTSLVQVKLAGGVKDIDEYLKAGGVLQAAIDNNKVSDTAEVQSDADASQGSIIEKDGAYFKVRYKDGNEYYIKLSNFVINLKNIFIRGEQREREVIITREDGKHSVPILITSDTKVSLKPFKALVANAIDASFYGKEDDMAGIWELVYKKGAENIVHLPDHVGTLEDFGGWLFRNVYINSTGATYVPDDAGAIWITGNTTGLKALPLSANGNRTSIMTDIPTVRTDITKEEVDRLIKGFAVNLAKNLGGENARGEVLTMLGWVKAVAYSNMIFRYNNSFPLLLLWGIHGRGKTTIIKLLLSLFGMEEAGHTLYGQLNSGVSFSRKLSYYASLPLSVDDIKVGEGQDHYPSFKAWWERGERTVANKDGFGVRSSPVRSCVIFGSEHMFTDDALRQRCIPVRIRNSGRETVESYKYFIETAGEMSAVGYQWIQESLKTNTKELLERITSLINVMKEAGIPDRSANNWAKAAVFGVELGREIFPDYNYLEYLKEATKVDTEQQQNDSLINQFWEIVEGLQAEERPKITGDHFRLDGDKMYIWLIDIIRIVGNELSRGGTKFSKAAIQEAIKEEPYFIMQKKHKCGMKDSIRRTYLIDITKAPDVLQSIAAYL